VVTLIVTSSSTLRIEVVSSSPPTDCPPQSQHTDSDHPAAHMRQNATALDLQYREDTSEIKKTLSNVTFYLITELMYLNKECTVPADQDWVWPMYNMPDEWYGEAPFTSLLRRSPYRTMDRKAATFFFVPVWPNCVDGKQTGLAHETLSASDVWKELYAAEPRRFIANEQTNRNAQALGEFFFRGTILNYEVAKAGDDPGRPWVSPSANAAKDIAMPYWESTALLYGLSDDLIYHHQRPFMFLAHWDPYKLSNLRLPIAELFTDPKGGLDQRLASQFGQGINHRDYAQEMTRSVFCVVAKGHTPTTRALFNVMSGGCIPILFSDSWNLPFASQLPYERFVVFAPEAPDGDKPLPADATAFTNKTGLQEQLRRLADDVRLQHFMRAEVIRYRRRFFFGLGTPDRWDADWDNAEALTKESNPETDFWWEGSLLVESVLVEAKQRVVDGWPGPQGPSPKRTIDMMKQQIDNLIALSRA
jgi:hypothetical protein